MTPQARKKKKAESDKAYRAKNKLKIAARYKAWSTKNKKRLSRYNHAYYIANKSSYKARAKEWKTNNRQKVREGAISYSRRYRNEHPDKVRVSYRGWREKREAKIKALIDYLKLAIVFKDIEIERLQNELKQRSGKANKTRNGSGRRKH